MTEPLLLEREDELAVLAGALSARARAPRQVLVVAGAAGLGKTSLLNALDGLAEAEGVRVLRAVGGQFEENIAFGVVRQLFEDVLAAETEQARAGLLGGAARFAGLTLDFDRPEPLPESQPEPLPDASRTETPFALLHGLYWLLVNLSQREPLLIAVDDLQWADTASLRWLLYLSRRLDGLDVLFAATLRTDLEVTDESLLTELRSGEHSRVLELGPLSESAVATLAGGLLDAEPDAEFTAACHRATRGNPLVLNGLLHQLGRDGVPPVAERVTTAEHLGTRVYCGWVLDVLRAQPEHVLRLGQALAVLGEETRVEVVREVAGLSAPTMARARATLERFGFLLPGRLRFQHPLVRLTVAESMPPEEWAAEHRRAARVLGDWGAPIDRVAAHLVKAGPPAGEEVVTVLRDAAGSALRRGAAEVAVSYLQHALDGRWPDELRVQLLSELSTAEQGIAPLAAKEHLLEALALVDSPIHRARAAANLVPMLTGSGAPTMVRILDEALGDLRSVDDEGPEVRELRLRLEAHLIYAAVEDESCLDIAHARLERLDPDALRGTPASSALLAVYTYLAAGAVSLDARRVTELAGRALHNSSTVDELLYPMLMGAMGALQMAEQIAPVLAWYDAGIENARARNWPMTHAMLSGGRALSRFRAGQVDDALDDAQTALGLHNLDYAGESQPMLVGAAVSCLAELGRWDEAEELVRRRAATGAGRSYRWCWLLHARARVRQARGDLRGALWDELECGRRLTHWRMDNPALLPWREQAALIHLWLDEREAAAKLADEALRIARAWGAPGPVGSALRTQALLRDDGERIGLLKQAVEHGERSVTPLELAKSLIELGVAQRIAGAEADARDTLRRGLDLASRCGATVLAERARAEMVAAGGRPRRNRETGLGALTPAERQVVLLAARGGSNRAIAEELFVTQRTVESHLTNSYRKLGLRTRAELAAVAAAD